MSRLAKKPILIEKGNTAVLDAGVILIKGSHGERKLKISPNVEIKIQDNLISVQTTNSSKQARADIGTTWSLVRNALEGVSRGFKKVLEIEGIGFKANLEGKKLVLSLGFSHPVNFETPEGIDIKVEKNQITITGIDKEKVGQAAAKIRAFKKPEPYKGKGIRYQGEVVRRKTGKKATATT